MQTIPSLIGTGTAVAAAASGLVFGEIVELPPTESAPSSSSLRPSTSLRVPSRSATLSPTYEPRSSSRLSNLSSSRPRTSSASRLAVTQDGHHHTSPNSATASRPPLSRYQRPKASLQSLTTSTSISTSTSTPKSIPTPKRYLGRRSSSRGRESPYSATAATPRDSISSNGSWYRRFSLRSFSQHDSERSSLGLDSASFAALSNGSTAPAIDISQSYNPPYTPNKLVKRSSSISRDSASLLSRRRSNSPLLTLRRPATSHQRSATLRQFQQTQAAQQHSSTPSAKNSLETSRYLQAALLPSPFESDEEPRSKSGWRSFFHSRTPKFAKIDRSVEDNPSNVDNRQNRILPNGREHTQGAYLIKPTMVSVRSSMSDIMISDTVHEEHNEQLESGNTDTNSQNVTSVRNGRRSISLSLSASNLMSKASGSLRRPKRGATIAKEDTSPRHVSDPVTGSRAADMSLGAAGGLTNTYRASPSAPNPYIYSAKHGPTSAASTNPVPAARARNSSPFSPLSSHSSFTMDLSRSGSLSRPANHHPLRYIHPSGSSTSSTAVSQSRLNHIERFSSIDGNECDLRDFMSVDDDDTDFKSDTMFDSIRTGTSDRMRNTDTPLDSMYDESPPSSTGPGKGKRLSIHDMLGKDWDFQNRIMEEDETCSTSTRPPAHGLLPSPHNLLSDSRASMDSSISKDLNRLSMDDDFDEDWAIDDAPYHSLHPPSRVGSVNSKAINPNMRNALSAINKTRSVSGNGMLDSASSETRSERPLSSIFDWSEGHANDKQDPTKPLSRPRTANPKEEQVSRGGRSAIRRGPAPAHVRSQSVPVVQDNPQPVNPKFGTWGLGSKPISEDWDDDFEFGGSHGNDDTVNKPCPFSVPESIQAAQPTIKAHSGQIRELSLLVNDLQRLCRHGREMDLMNGPCRDLWKEAEAIIALASPDEASLEAGHDCSSSVDFDAFETTDRQFDDDTDSLPLEKLDAALEGREPIMSRTAVVRERPSPRRRSVFSPDDDIFGRSWPKEDATPPCRSSRPMTPEQRTGKANDVNGVVRTVVEVMQQRPLKHRSLDHLPSSTVRRMHFDTNSLKSLVKSASDLRDTLSGLVRGVDRISNSPAVRTPRHNRPVDSSPAFTKVFDGPGTSPPRRMSKSLSNTVNEDSTPHKSPSSGANRRLHAMMVN